MSIKNNFPNIGGLRLIACDLDGTLLLNGAQQLQEDTCELIHCLAQKGIVFMAASGRQYESLRRLFSPVRDEIAYLCENGCISFCRGQMVHQITMDDALSREMIEDIQSAEGCEVLVSGRNVSYIKPKKMSYYYHMRDEVQNNVEIVEDLLQIPEPYMKISIYREGGLTGADFRYWEDAYGSRAHVVTGGNAWMDMMPKGVDKASGMQPLLELMDISPEQCMAIGDNYNDREMLQMAGMPVSVNTAKPEIYAMCRDHTDTVEHYLERILNEL